MNPHWVCHKVIPALMVAGMTFFLWSCQPRAPVGEVPDDNFTMGETYRQQGELDRALDAYRAYLEQKPGSDMAALAYHRMAQTYLEMGKEEQALETLRKIQQRFPEYRGIPEVRLDVARTLYRTGQLEASRSEVLQWLRMYPEHPLRREALELAGDAADVLGRPVEAFRWWLAAKRAWMGDLEREWQLNEKLAELLTESPPEVLEALVPYAEGTDYAPELYYTMAHLYLEQNELDQARAAAMALVRSTPEQYWVSLGRDLLEQIRDELSVRTGALGCLLPLSGSFAIYGEEVLNGVELGMELFSGTDSDAIDELIIRDTKDAPEAAVAALEEIVEAEDVIAVIGPLSSKTALPVAQRAQQLGVPLITLTQRLGVTQVGDMVFRNFITPSREVERLVSAAVGGMGIKRFAILYPENSYGRLLVDLFWEALEAVGGRVTAIESYSPEETDFAEQIQKMTGLYYRRPPQLVQKLARTRTWEEEESIIRSNGPQPIVDFDAVFIPDSFRRVAMIAPQLVYHDVLDVQLLGTSLWQGAQLVDLTGEYVQGAVFSSGFFEGSQLAGVDAFVKEYRTNFGSDPGVLAATGYDTIRMLRHMLSTGSIRTRRDLRERLLGDEVFQGVTGSIYFDDQGEVQKKPLLLTVSGNRITTYP